MFRVILRCIALLAIASCIESALASPFFAGTNGSSAATGASTTTTSPVLSPDDFAQQVHSLNQQVQSQLTQQAGQALSRTGVGTSSAGEGTLPANANVIPPPAASSPSVPVQQPYRSSPPTVGPTPDNSVIAPAEGTPAYSGFGTGGNTGAAPPPQPAGGGGGWGIQY